MRTKAFMFFLSFCLGAMMICAPTALAAPQETCLTIDAPSILSGNVAAIRVYVKDEEGEPVADGTVTLGVSDRLSGGQAKNLYEAGLIPDPDGLVEMTLPDLEAGVYRVSAEFVPADPEEYQDSEQTQTLEVKVPVKLFEKPRSAQSTYPYGTTLEKIGLVGGKCNVAGRFVFRDPEQKLNIGNNYVPILFEPEDSFYGEKDFSESVTVTIVAATPVLSNVDVSGTVDDGRLIDATITGDALNPVTGKKVAGTLSIKDPEGVIDPDNHTIEVVFNPANTQHYRSVSAQASLKVNAEQSTASSRTTQVAGQQAVESSGSTIEVIAGDWVEVISQDPATQAAQSAVSASSSYSSALASGPVSELGVIDGSFPSSRILGCLAVGITLMVLGLVVFRNKIF